VKTCKLCSAEADRPPSLVCRICYNTTKKAKYWEDRGGLVRQFNYTDLGNSTRVCCKCKEVKSLESGFHNYRKDGKVYKSYVCKPCNSLYNLKRIPGYIKRKALAGGWAPPRMSDDDLRAFVKNHNGICDFPRCPRESTHTDHCHESGQVRGRLCNTHNMGLGLFHDNTDELQDAIEYLSKWGK
jgi:recombination endonuclease VII